MATPTVEMIWRSSAPPSFETKSVLGMLRLHGRAPPLRRRALAIRLKGERDGRGKVRGWAFTLWRPLSLKRLRRKSSARRCIHKNGGARSPPAKKPIRGAAPRPMISNDRTGSTYAVRTAITLGAIIPAWRSVMKEQPSSGSMG